ncbi:MAG: type III polyketide synthase, partial [Chitinophagales bacterium]|nr:type III polyketide synthase [Chitinophagales bacterium]
MKNNNKEGSYVAAIGTAVAQYRYPQQVIADFMIRYFKLNEEASRKTNLVYHKSGIKFRHSVLADFSMNGNAPELFATDSSSPLLSKRLNVYDQNALKLSVAAVADCLNEFESSYNKSKPPAVSHLITVSCTGMAAPGLDIQLMKALNLPGDTERTSINFIGCYASFHALKIADAICLSNENAVVLIVAVEICSIHFQPAIDNENLVVNSLFADGAAAAIVISEKIKKKFKGAALQINGFYGEVLHAGESLMSWKPNENGFLMGLDPSVPQLIEDESSKMINRALKKFRIKKSEITNWALHPGGRKILEAAQKSIQINEDDLKHSYNV